MYSATKLGTGTKSVGNGVNLANVSQNFSNGGMDSTGNVLDMGVQGNGFFVLNTNGSLSYTRGQLQEREGRRHHQNPWHRRLQGVAADANGNNIPGVLTNMRIDTSKLGRQTTTQIGSTLNLDSTSAVITAPFDPATTSTYTQPFSTTIYDTQGNSHSLDQVHGQDRCQYLERLFADRRSQPRWYGADHCKRSAARSAAPHRPVPVAVTFDSSGKLASIGGSATATSITVTGWVPGTVTAGVFTPNQAGANPAGIAVDFSKTTQFNADTARSAPTTDGYATGQITDITIDSTGVISANFSNQQHKAIGQVALASFTNEQGLQAVGGTNWTQTFASGQPSYAGGAVGTNGTIISGSLESSNVDLTSELVDLIKGQSYYQANAKTISTESTIMQTIIQMA